MATRAKYFCYATHWVRMAMFVFAKFSKVGALVVRAFGNLANHAHRIRGGEFLKFVQGRAFKPLALSRLLCYNPAPSLSRLVQRQVPRVETSGLWAISPLNLSHFEIFLGKCQAAFGTAGRALQRNQPHCRWRYLLWHLTFF